MSIFERIFNSLLKEDVSAATAFGPEATGKTAGQFPAQNDLGYNPGNGMPLNPYNAILGSKKKNKRKNKKKNKKVKFPIQRRNFANL